MLKRAILYRDKIGKEMARVCDDPQYRFYAFRYWDLAANIDTDNYSRHQFASVDSEDNVVGYFSSNIDQKGHFLSQFGMVRFDNKSMVFPIDLRRFFLLMFGRYSYRKICFSVAVGSPHESMYDRFIRDYNGRIVGSFKDHIVLPDGKVCDEKFYEIFQKEFEATYDYNNPIR